MNNRDWLNHIADDDMAILREALCRLLLAAYDNNYSNTENIEDLAWDFGLNLDAARGPIGTVTP